MERVRPGTHGVFTSTWSDLGITHRQAPNHPFPLSDTVRNYEDYPWELIDGIFKLKPQPLPEGQLPFTLGVYERAPGNFRTGTFANFWNDHSGDALGVFIQDVEGWRDYEYAYEVESPTLQVRYHFVDGKFYWKWPVVHGRRTTCIAFYDHAKDREAMRLLEQDFKTVQQEGISYAVPLTFTSHVLFLQNRHGTLDLNRVKDWVLEYPASARHPAPLLGQWRSTEPTELERRVMTSPFVCTLPVTGTRQMAGHGPIPGRNIVNFSPVPSRQMAGWVEGFNQCNAALTDRQRRRLTAMFLVLAHELGPTFEHQYDVEVGLVAMPAGAFFRRFVGFHQLRDDPPASGVGDAQVTVKKEVAQTIAPPDCVAWFHVGEFTDKRLFEHGPSVLVWAADGCRHSSAARLSRQDPPSGRFPRASGS